MKRQALGRGLSALLSEEFRDSRDQLTEVDIASLVPNNRQPRTTFDEEALGELTRSLESNGLIQPIVVRREGSRLEIVAGERRYRAAKKLGWKKIPAIVRELPPQKSLELALVENLQRQDLNPIEEAKAYEWLIQDFGLGQDEVAKRVGKDRTSVANTLRLLKLPADVQKLVVERKLSMGHARALLGVSPIDKLRALAERCVRDSLSVRQVEEAVREAPPAPAPAVAAGKPAAGRAVSKDVHDRAAERKLEQKLGTRVLIKRARRGGRVEIAFYSEEELQRIYELMLAED